MSDKLRVGVAGCGKISRVSHVPGFLKVPAVKIVALCDSDRGRMDEVCKEHKIQPALFTDYAEMLKSGLDAVSICTPNFLHKDMSLAAFAAGLHVLCEKPMAATLPEATAMIRAARKAKKILQINQSVRYSGLYVTIGELIKSGAIGEAFHIRCIRAGGNTPDKGWSPGATWFVSKASQGGLVLDIGIHMADMMEWVMGGDVEKIAALVDTRIKEIDVPDNVSALFRFRNGATGILELSWTMPSGAGVLEIYGTKGRIRQGATEKPIELTRIVDGKSEVTFPEQKAGVKDSFAAFVDAIHGVAPSPTSGEMGRNALALCDAIAKSGGTGRFVKVQKFAR